MTRDWWLISDIDGTLTGDPAALAELTLRLERNHDRIGFGVASGRSPELVAEAVAEFSLPQPELVIASVGTQISGAGISPEQWPAGQLADWRPAELRELLSGLAGIELQSEAGQGPHKLGFLASAAAAQQARQAVSSAGLKANLLHSAGEFLDVLPAGVSKGSAVRFFAARSGLPLERIVVAGDTGNDRDMLLCGARAILVANHTAEVSDLVHEPAVFSSHARHAAGILEGLSHYRVWE